MPKLRKILGRIFNPLSSEEYEYLPDGAIVFDEEGKIISYGKRDQVVGRFPGEDFVLHDHSGSLLVPGFSDPHLHPAQLHCCNSHRGELMDWLDGVALPAEKRFSDQEFATKVLDDFFEEVLRWGITSLGAFLTAHRAPVRYFFERAAEYGLKGFAGRVVMDLNGDDPTERVLEESISLFREHDGTAGERFNYAFTPRFAPSCSRRLLEATARFAQDNNARIQTHLAETISEIQATRNSHNPAEHPYDLFRSCGLDGPRVVFAHAVHLQDDHFEQLARATGGVAHCPDSNLFLQSGKMDYDRMRAHGVKFALASDIGAGTTLSPFHHMRVFREVHGKEKIIPLEAFYRATLAGAETLGVSQFTGHFTLGGDADIVVLDSREASTIAQELSWLIDNGTEEIIRAVFVRGREIERRTHKQYHLRHEQPA
jgi:guanine deaminase